MLHSNQIVLNKYFLVKAYIEPFLARMWLFRDLEGVPMKKHSATNETIFNQIRA